MNVFEKTRFTVGMCYDGGEQVQCDDLREREK